MNLGIQDPLRPNRLGYSDLALHCNGCYPDRFSIRSTVQDMEALVSLRDRWTGCAGRIIPKVHGILAHLNRRGPGVVPTIPNDGIICHVPISFKMSFISCNHASITGLPDSIAAIAQLPWTLPLACMGNMLMIFTLLADTGTRRCCPDDAPQMLVTAEILFISAIIMNDLIVVCPLKGRTHIICNPIVN